VADNYKAGQRRQQQVHQELEKLYPGASVQDELFLRDKDGNIAVNPKTGKSRRLDHVVIENGQVLDVVETTSLTAEKKNQINHEIKVREGGGEFIRDRRTGELLEVTSVSRIERKL